MNFKNIHPSLCNFCGACTAICPAKCLSLGKEKIIFDKDKCINCALCYKSCQGVEFDFPKARELYKRSKFNEILGSYTSLYLGQSINDNILETSSSGGLVPELLIYALKKGLINGAVMVQKDKDKPLGYKISVAKTKKEILYRSPSLYRLVPVNSILDKIKDEKNLAFVGVPCQVEAIRKLQMNNHPSVKNIKLIIGIFCGLNQSTRSVEFLLKKLKIKEEDVIEFSQRKKDFSKGRWWPGGFYIKTKNNKEHFLTKDMYEYLYYRDASPRCLLCYDYTNEFADISLGDGWHKLPSKKGWSEIIVRSKPAEKLLIGLRDEKRINLEKTNENNIIAAHPGHINLKKKGIFRRLKKAKFKPNFHITPKKFDKKTEYSQILTFTLIKFIRSPFMNIILTLFPLKLIGFSTSVFRKTLRFVIFRKKKSKNSR